MAMQASKRLNEYLCQAETSFFDQNRILEYLNSVVKVLKEDPKTKDYIVGNVEFLVQTIPINLADVTINMENGTKLTMPYLTQFLNDSIESFISENLVVEEKKNHFKQYRRGGLFNFLLKRFSDAKYKRLSGLSYIYCNNKYVIAFLTRRNHLGEENLLRDYLVNEETGLKYTKQDEEEYIKTAGVIIPEIHFIDLNYVPLDIKDYCDYIINNSPDLITNSDKLAVKKLYEFCLDYVKQVIEYSSDNENNNKVFNLILPSELSRYKLDIEIIDELLKVIKLKVLRTSAGNKDSAFYGNLMSIIKNNNQKGTIPLKITKKTVEKLVFSVPPEGINYALRVYTTDKVEDVFMRDLFKAISSRIRREAFEWPSLPKYYQLFTNSLNELISEQFGLTLPSQSEPIITYNRQMSNEISEIEDIKNSMSDELTEKFGDLKKDYVVPLPFIKLNNREKEWVTRIRKVVEKNIDEDENMNKDPEQIKSDKLSLQNLDPEGDYFIKCRDYEVDFKARVTGDLLYDISQLRVSINRELSYIPISELRTNMEKINVLSKFFEPFCNRSIGNTVKYSIERDVSLSAKRYSRTIEVAFRVSYSDPNDMYDATKFRTNFLVRSDMPANPNDIKYYTMSWAKTEEQSISLSGVEGEVTNKLFLAAEGARLEYPFVDDKYRIPLEKSFMDEINYYNSVYRTREARNNATRITENYKNTYDSKVAFENFGNVTETTELARETQKSFYSERNKSVFGIDSDKTVSFVNAERTDARGRKDQRKPMESSFANSFTSSVVNQSFNKPFGANRFESLGKVVRKSKQTEQELQTQVSSLNFFKEYGKSDIRGSRIITEEPEVVEDADGFTKVVNKSSQVRQRHATPSRLRAENSYSSYESRQKHATPAKLRNDASYSSYDSRNRSAGRSRSVRGRKGNNVITLKSIPFGGNKGKFRKNNDIQGYPDYSARYNSPIIRSGSMSPSTKSFNSYDRNNSRMTTSDSKSVTSIPSVPSAIAAISDILDTGSSFVGSNIGQITSLADLSSNKKEISNITGDDETRSHISDDLLSEEHSNVTLPHSFKENDDDISVSKYDSISNVDEIEEDDDDDIDITGY